MSFTNISDLSSWRYTSIGLGAVPLVAVFASNFYQPRQWPGWKKHREDQVQKNKFVYGQPPRKSFGLIWFLLLVLLFISVLIAACNIDADVLGLYIAFVLLFAVMCVAWTMTYKSGYPKHASLILVLCVMLSVCLLSITATAPIDPTVSTGNGSKWTNTAMSLCIAPLLAWTAVAYGFNFSEINK